MTCPLASALRSKILRLLLLHWSPPAIVEEVHCHRNIVYTMQENLFMYDSPFRPQFRPKSAPRKVFPALKTRMLQTVSELRYHKRKEFDLQRLLNLVKKRLYVVAEKKERQFSLIAAHRSVWCRHAVLSFHFSVSFSGFWISWTYEHVYPTPPIETIPSLSAWLMAVAPDM